MPFQPVILITDALFFLLTAGLISFVFIARSREHLRRPWQKVVKRTTGVVSLVVLLTFYSIAILDSLHFHPKLENSGDSDHQYSNEILSVLDIAMTPMRTHVEKTFSAPLSTHLFSKEMVSYEDGSVEQIYPRLEYGGAHLVDPVQEKTGDILKIILKAVVLALTLWLPAWLVIIYWRAKSTDQKYSDYLHSTFKGETIYPLRAVAITSGIITLIIVGTMSLGAQYHLFGTDKVGQDVFYQTVKSIRTGILIGSLTTLVMLPVAIILGAMAGFFRGWVDDIIQYLYTTLNSI
ncbi:MAG: ABC transporter permease, partial [Pseudomonadota bacterium]